MRLLAASLGAPTISLLLSCGGTATPGAPTPSAPPASAPASSVPGPALAWRSLLAGNSPEMRGARAEHVLRSDAEWVAWLATMHASPAEAPAVDFAREVVVAVDGEDGSNGCHAVRIDGISRQGSATRVEVTRWQPGPQRACTMMMVRPFHAVAIPLPEGGAEHTFTFTWRAATGEPKP